MDVGHGRGYGVWDMGRGTQGVGHRGGGVRHGVWDTGRGVGPGSIRDLNSDRCEKKQNMLK